MRFKDCHFGQFGTINARYISRYYRVSGELIPLRNRSKLVERSLFAVINLLQGAKSISFVIYMSCGGMIFMEKNFKFQKKNFFFTFIFLMIFMFLLLHKL